MSDRPNLLFIMPDQMRHDFLSCYGAPHISTPNIDRIAAEGIRYDQARTACIRSAYRRVVRCLLASMLGAPTC